MSTSTEYQPKTRTGRITNFVDPRVGGSGIVKEFGRKIFPDHWTFMFGEVALYSFVILLLSGTFLTFFFDPSMAETHYDGSLHPAQGRGDVRGLRVHAGHLLRSARRTVHASAAPLVGADVRCPCRSTCSACSSPARSAGRAS